MLAGLVALGVYYLQDFFSLAAWLGLLVLGTLYFALFVVGAYVLKLHALELIKELLVSKLKYGK